MFLKARLHRRFKPGFHMIVRIVPVVSKNVQTVGTTETIAGFHKIVSIASKTEEARSSAFFSWVRQQNFGAIFANKMADVNRRANLLACYLFILLILRRRRARRIPRRHRFWVREIYRKREELGAYHTLVQELRLHDRAFFFR